MAGSVDLVYDTLVFSLLRCLGRLCKGQGLHPDTGNSDPMGKDGSGPPTSVDKPFRRFNDGDGDTQCVGPIRPERTSVIHVHPDSPRLPDPSFGRPVFRDRLDRLVEEEYRLVPGLSNSPSRRVST